MTPIQSTVVAWRRLQNRLGRRGDKVFAIGFNKCGTTSLHALFLSLGRPSNHGVEWRKCQDLALLRSYDCFSDGIPDDLPKLDRLFPDAKYILQVRDLRSWVYSRLAHIERGKQRPGYTTTDVWDDTPEAVVYWVAKWNEHHRYVLDYFADRPGDLLVVNFIRDPEAATKVATFLGAPGDRARPKRNTNPRSDTPQRFVELLDAALAKLGVPSDEADNDLLCPSLLPPEDRDRYPATIDALEAKRPELAGASVAQERRRVERWLDPPCGRQEFQ